MLQKGLFGGLALGANASVQLEFRRADRKPVKAATIKGKSGETEQLPLYTNKDSIVGEASRVHVCLQGNCSHACSAMIFIITDQSGKYPWQKAGASGHSSPTAGPNRVEVRERSAQ